MTTRRTICMGSFADIYKAENAKIGEDYSHRNEEKPVFE